MKSAKTFINAGRENVIVYSSALRPLYFLISLNNLETLNTLRTLPNYGPTLMILKVLAFKKDIEMSTKLEITTQKSNTFQLFLK